MAEEQARTAAIEAWIPIAEQLDWQRPWTTFFREDPPYHHWFVDGRFSLAANCTDRHLAERAESVAFHWEGEPGDRRSVTFAELHDEVLRLAAGLRRVGVEAGDRVALHLGWLPETVVAMLAAWRLGAEVTVIPVALPVEALASRLADYRPKVLFTQDGGWRRGAILPLKARADEAIESTSGVQHTIVLRRTGVHVEWFEGDRWYDDVVTAAPDPAAAELPAEHPAIGVYLANRRGRPVAIHVGAANAAVVALANHRYAMCRGDVFWGAADISWLGAQSHGILGPLLAGTTSVMYEGTLDFPDPTRAWQIIERYGVTSLLTSPSVVRSLRGWSMEPSHTTGSLQRVVCIGERLDPELRTWLGGVIGPSVDVVDAWGQLELGGIVAHEPGVASPELPDPGFAILDEAGSPVPDGVTGEWVLQHPWAGLLRAVEADGAPTAYHWERHPGHYSTGDLARRTTDGGVEFLGRLDEVTSISGQLVSLTEVRDVLLDQPFVARAEVFERADAHLGRTVGAAIVLEPGAPDDEPTLRALLDSVRDLLGGLSRPRVLLVLDRIGDELPAPAARQALAVAAGGAASTPVRLTWDQLVAAAR
jgi:acetyl-CoA synthetase